jgi:hypothetical protein
VGLFSGDRQGVVSSEAMRICVRGNSSDPRFAAAALPQALPIPAAALVLCSLRTYALGSQRPARESHLLARGVVFCVVTCTAHRAKTQTGRGFRSSSRHTPLQKRGAFPRSAQVFRT